MGFIWIDHDFSSFSLKSDQFGLFSAGPRHRKVLTVGRTAVGTSRSAMWEVMAAVLVGGKIYDSIA